MNGRLDRWRLRLALGLVSALRFLVPRRHRAAWLAEWRGELCFLSRQEWPARPAARAGGRAPDARPDVLAHSLTSIPHAAAHLRHEWSPDMLLQDIRHALRRLIKAPGFTIVAMLTIAIGVGANTTIFSVIDSTMLNPLPYPDADRLVYLWKQAPGMNLLTTPNADDVRRWREQSTSFEEIQVYAGESATLTGGEEPRDLEGLRVLPGFFDFLGVQPARGREFAEEESRTDAPVAIISHGLWRSYFGGADDVLGRTLTLNDQPRTVIGVMPADFHFQAPFDDTELWLPMSLENGEEVVGGFAIARLREGVGAEAANDELAAIAANLDSGGDASVAWAGKARRARDMIGDTFRTSLLMLQAAVAVVLLIACANVANLLLARGTGRESEMAVRAALGAGRGRLFRQALTEHLILALAGGLAGYGLARAGVAAIMLSRPEQIAALASVRVDVWIFFLAIGGAVVTGVVFGLVPALQVSRPRAAEQLKQAGRTGAALPGRSWLRGALVVAEVALALVLLVGAGLLIGSLSHLLNADLGFDTSNVLTMSVHLPESRYPEDAQRLQFRDEIESRIRQVAGARLEGLAISGGLPPSLGLSFGTFAAEGEEPLPAFTNIAAHYGLVAPGFFATLHIPLVDGRGFTENDVDSPDDPVIINAGWARRMWGDEKAAGRRFRSGGGEDPSYHTVVGVIDDVQLTGPTGGFNELQIYVPGMAFESLGLMIRTTGDPLPLADAIRKEIWALDAGLPIENAGLLDDLYAGRLSAQRFNTTLMAVFAGVALLLALIGVYGVLSYSIGQRTREIGIRMALGARRGDVVPMVVWQGMRMVVAGIVVGLAGALAVTRFIASLLYEVSAADPAIYAVVALALAAVGALACLIPARRAARLDAMVALRGE